ncbi:fimbrial biogenesis chaperone [Lysobacter enzymogenes]|uniref:fimbrial biogenesis chaperone n=1 Tax=Lysobacter enzymogenes TaxID=69 RepID=UPI00099DD00E|nr:molecular chaperone [Lysobacter enzymogenes]UZW62195.1 molecular chaperone [Lysobacter enzymogenes]
MFLSARSFSRCFLPAATLALLSAGQAHAASSILIWPIDPVIESDERAAALWLENRGKTPAQMQLRVFGWRQADGENAYDAQTEVLGSPPMIRIEPGQRQLVRLTRTVDVADGSERAYRVLIDEIPTPETESAESADKASVGIKFQMRYSVPLFVYGKGLWAKQNPEKKRDPASAARPTLQWRAVGEGGKTLLEIRNTGTVHAKLSEVAFGPHPVAAGQLGYVLPGNAMRWPLPQGMKAEGTLTAKINGGEAPQPIPAAGP